jgi:hypothetical protein
MAETTVVLNDEVTTRGRRYVHRSTIAAGDTLNVIGLPPERQVSVKVYPGASATVSVYSTSDSEVNIRAGTAEKQLWSDGAVTADAEDVLSSGHSGVIIASATDICYAEVSA